GKHEDLGRMHPTDMYARSIAAGTDGWLYIGIGTKSGDIIAYNPETREHHSVLPESLRQPASASSGSVSVGDDGTVYGSSHGKALRLEAGRATIVDSIAKPAPVKLRDGRILVARDRGTFSLRDPKTDKVIECTFKYQATGDSIFVVGNGPGGQV